MNTTDRRLLPLLLLMMFALPLHAQQREPSDTAAQLRYDSSQVTTRAIAGEKLERYRKDEEFRYEDAPNRPLTIWEQIRRWLQSLLWGATASLAPFWKIIAYVIFGAGLVYVILKLIGVDPRGVFYRSGKGGLDFQVTDENIHEMEFDTLIAEAVRKREYRRAIRLHYLQSLKELTDREMIAWRPDRTNHEYLQELSGSPSRNPFERITTIFEYSWYGNFPVGEEIYRFAEREFSTFHRQLSGSREAV
jgi:hypothetical protein